MPSPLKSWSPPRLKARVTKEVDHYRSADWLARRRRILIRDGFRCAVCGRVVSGKAAHVDHVVPLEEGGTDADSNLQVLCDKDHGRKTRAEQGRRGLL